MPCHAHPAAVLRQRPRPRPISGGASPVGTAGMTSCRALPARGAAAGAAAPRGRWPSLAPVASFLAPSVASFRAATLLPASARFVRHRWPLSALPSCSWHQLAMRATAAPATGRGGGADEKRGEGGEADENERRGRRRGWRLGSGEGKENWGKRKSEFHLCIYMEGFTTHYRAGLGWRPKPGTSQRAVLAWAR